MSLNTQVTHLPSMTSPAIGHVDIRDVFNLPADVQEAAIKTIAEHGRDSDEWRQFKSNRLPAIIAGTRFMGRGNANAVTDPTGFVMVDLDGMDEGTATELVADFWADEHVLLAGRSASWHGVHVFYRVDPVPTTVDEFRYAWAACAEHATAISCGRGKNDTACKNAERLCFYSRDEQAHQNWRPNATPITWSPPDAHTAHTERAPDPAVPFPTTVSNNGRPPSTGEWQGLKIWNDAREPIPTPIEHPNRHNSLVRLVGAMKNVAWDDAVVRLCVDDINRTHCAPPLDADRMSAVYEAIERYPTAPPHAHTPPPRAMWANTGRENESGDDTSQAVDINALRSALDRYRAERKQLLDDKKSEEGDIRTRLRRERQKKSPDADAVKKLEQERDALREEIGAIESETDAEIAARQATIGCHARQQREEYEQRANAEREARGQLVLGKYPTGRDFSHALDHLGIEIRFDERSMLVTIGMGEFPAELIESHNANLRPDGRLPTNDHIDAWLLGYIRDNVQKTVYDRETQSDIEVPWVINESNYRLWISEHISTRYYDPFKDWLEELVWDATPRLDTWLLECLDSVEIKSNDLSGEQKKKLIEWCSKSVHLAAVRRTYEPATKHDATPIIVGAQGMGKSTIFKHSFPDDWQDWWYKEKFTLTTNTQRWVENSQAGVIVELAELAGLTETRVRDLKAHLSATTDQVRLAYRKNPAIVRRKFVFLGTSNNTSDGILPHDETGNRRWVVYHATGHPDRVRAYLNKNREQLWAEAYHRYKNDEATYLTRELEQIAAISNDAASSKSVFSQLVTDAMVGGELEAERFYTPQEIAQVTGLVRRRNTGNGGSNEYEKKITESTPTADDYDKLTRTETREVCRDLRSLDWRETNMRRNGVVGRYWRYKENNKYLRPESGE